MPSNRILTNALKLVQDGEVKPLFDAKAYTVPSNRPGQPPHLVTVLPLGQVFCTCDFGIHCGPQWPDTNRQCTHAVAARHVANPGEG